MAAAAGEDERGEERWRLGLCPDLRCGLEEDGDWWMSRRGSPRLKFYHPRRMRRTHSTHTAKPDPRKTKAHPSSA